jgi:HEAT repeat protein
MDMFRLLITIAAFLLSISGAKLSGIVTPKRVDLPPTDAQFRAQVKKLDKTIPKEERLKAVEWLDRNCKSKDAKLAIPGLEQCIRADPEAKIRRTSIRSLAAIELNLKMPCPLVIVEAMLDKGEDVSVFACISASEFVRFAPKCREILLQCAQSDDVSLRSDSVGHLARGWKGDKEILKVLEAAINDKDFGVRHNAYTARFHATGNLKQYLVYLLLLQEDRESVLGPIDLNSEVGKREKESCDFIATCSCYMLAEWTETNPHDLAVALLELTESPSPTIRRGAARIIGASSEKVDLATLYPHHPSKPAKAPAKPNGPPPPSKAAIELEKMKVRDRLHKLSEKDSDPTVRAAAEQALERFAKIPEK